MDVGEGLGVFPHLEALEKSGGGKKGEPLTLLRSWPMKKASCVHNSKVEAWPLQDKEKEWESDTEEMGQEEEIDEKAHHRFHTRIAAVRAMKLVVPTRAGEGEEQAIDEDETLEYIATTCGVRRKFLVRKKE